MILIYKEKLLDKRLISASAFLPYPLANGTEAPTQMPQTSYRRRQSANLPLLDSDQRYAQQRGYLSASDQDVVVELGKLLKKQEISIHKNTESQDG